MGPTNQRGGSPPAIERPGIAHLLVRNTWALRWRVGRANTLATIQTTTKIQGQANILVGSALVIIQTHPNSSLAPNSPLIHLNCVMDQHYLSWTKC